MTNTINQTINQMAYRLAVACAVAMLCAYFAALGMALHAYSVGDENGALLWAMLMLVPLTLLWLVSVLAAPFVRDLDAAKTTPASPTTPTWEG